MMGFRRLGASCRLGEVACDAFVPLSLQRTSVPLFARPPLPVRTFERSSSNEGFADEPRGPTAINPLQVGPPTRRVLATGRAPPLLRSRSATRSCPSAVQTYRLSIVGAPHTVSTEHGRDSQRR